MEKRILANVCRGCLILFTISFAAVTSHAQLVNGGFETTGTNYVFPQADNLGHVVTNLFADSWTPNGGAFVVRTSTNSPQGDTYEDIDSVHDYVGLSNSASSVTALTSTYALRAFGPFAAGNALGSGAFQTITSNTVAAVSNNTIWVLSGSLLNWSGDPLTDTGLGSVSFGLIQILFQDGNGTNLGGAFDGPSVGTNSVMDTWISCSVTGTAPAGTAQIQVFALHVGNLGGLGSIFFDNLSITNIGVAPPPPPIITNQFEAVIQTGNQICYATVSTSSYLPQFSDDNVNWTGIGTPIPGDGTTNCVFAPTHKFYRVVQSQGGASVLSNVGFESGAASNEDSNAASWTQFNTAFRTSTNIPAGSPGGSGFGLSAHSGAFSMKTFGPFNPTPDASGAYQNFSTTGSGNLWRFTGYVLNGVNDQLAGPDGYGAAEIVFLDNTGGTGNVLQTTSTLHYGTDLPVPLNTWQKFEVDAVAPAGVQTVRAQVIHVGRNTDTGSMWYDDVSLYQVTGSNVNTVSTQPAVLVAWPTSPPTNGIRYQIQSTPALVFTNLPAINALTNAGFEANAVSNAADTGVVAGWNLANGGGKATSSAPKPTHSGIGALRLVDTTTAVPVAWQGSPTSINIIPVTPGQVWDETGYGYVWSSDQPLNPACDNGALLKIVWLDSTGATLQPLGSDTNLIGTAVSGQYAGIESAHITGGSPHDSWIPMEARGTAPPNTAYAQAFCILVGNNGGGAVRFDDIVFTTGGTHNGWQNFGPIYPGTGNTNSVYDTTTGKSNQFYRVTTP